MIYKINLNNFKIYKKVDKVMINKKIKLFMKIKLFRIKNHVTVLIQKIILKSEFNNCKKIFKM